MDCMLYLVMACGPFCWIKTVVSIYLFVFSFVYLLPIILLFSNKQAINDDANNYGSI